MKLTLLVIGRVRGPLAAAVADYEARLAHYWRFEVIELEAGAGGRDDADSVMAAEGERILSRIDPRADVVVLDRTGRGRSSRELADFLGEHAVRGGTDLVFVIGGAWGVAAPVLARARLRLSLGPLTLPHEMARLVLVEQLYRAGTILRNEPYHKGRD